MAIPYFGEEVSGLHGAAPSMGAVDEVEAVARPRQLAVLHRIPRHLGQCGVELSGLSHRDDGVLLPVDDEEWWSFCMNARDRRCSSEDLWMASLAVPHHDSFEKSLEVLAFRGAPGLPVVATVCSD